MSKGIYWSKEYDESEHCAISYGEYRAINLTRTRNKKTGKFSYSYDFNFWNEDGTDQVFPSVTVHFKTLPHAKAFIDECYYQFGR